MSFILLTRVKQSQYKAVNLPILTDKPEESFRHQKQCLRKAAIVNGRLANTLLQLFILLAQQRIQKTAFTAKIIVHRRLRQTRGIHNLLNTHRVISSCVKQIQRICEDFFPVIHAVLPFLNVYLRAIFSYYTYRYIGVSMDTFHKYPQDF